MKPIPVSEVGERPLIGLLTKIFRGGSNPQVIVGPGNDDCAVLEMPGDEYLVVTTDMLHRKTDFPTQMTGWQIGWMSAAVNFSDIASMGASPVGFLSAIGLPRDTDVSLVEDIARGMADCAKMCGTSVIGGDIDTHDELTITGTALGMVRKGELLTRKGARVGDKVCVTGFTGSAGAALHAIENNIDVPDRLMKALLEPFPRVYEARELAGCGFVTSMMDTSDGLALSLHDLADLNQVGFLIYESLLPVHADVREHVSSDPQEIMDLALYTGGDFELLFTASPGILNQVFTTFNLSIIGEVVEQSAGMRIERDDGTNLSINRKGYLQLGN
jgi:thiamine-monophosphate kinase